MTLTTYAAPLRPKPVDTISTEDVLAVLKPIWTVKPETADPGFRMRVVRLALQRLLVFALGVLTIWLIVFVVFDVAEHRLPLVFAVVITYGIAAYVILPRAIRIGLRILQRGRVPSYTTTGDGLPGDPVNLALIGTMRQLHQVFASAGWSKADPLSIVSSWRMVRAFLLSQPYPTAPFSTLYLFGRGQDVGFQQPIGDSPRKRNHVRFWGLPLERVEIHRHAVVLAQCESPGRRRTGAVGRSGDKGHWIFADPIELPGHPRNSC